MKDREAWSAADHGPWDPNKLDPDCGTEQQQCLNLYSGVEILCENEADDRV